MSASVLATEDCVGRPTTCHPLMNRRHFLLGSGSAAIGATALIGTGAFTGVVSKRSAKISVAHDRDAYLGLKRSDGPNRSFVDYDRKNHLRIRMDRKNPTEGGGVGVNSDSTSWFDNLFHICNQGKEAAKIFILKSGPEPDRVTFYHGGHDTGYEIIGGQTLEVSECLEVGLFTHTKSIKAPQRLLDHVIIIAVAKSAFGKETRPKKLLESVELTDKDPDDWVLNGP
ncbi:hypothetical protein ACLI4U_04095 [Natrialbaceae archaeon A-CW2]|uniref:hypothetical protein n=1 Tax=Natronosalvus amylolyticus TaxID=2961994 RepID=UPI0020C9A85F|nr:hypothetical protein [Natronosalvus amylolyticus]